MPITDASKAKIQARLSRAMGHLNAVYRMVDEKKYCVDVLHQLKAVQAALDKVSEEILREHLHTCVIEAVQAQDAQRMMQELMEVFRRAPELDLQLDAAPTRASASVATTSSGQAARTACCS